MSNENDFNAILEERLGNYLTYLNKKVLPRLRESFSYFQSIFENVYNYLIRKAVIKEDPYKYDQKTTEISIPPNEPFTESEKQTEMSHRLASYHSQLELINNFYQFDIDFLNPARIKKIAALLKYINWASSDSSGGNSTTSVLFALLDTIKQGSDKMASDIVTDSRQRLAKLSREIMKDLKILNTYHRERYKLEVRKTLIGDLKKELSGLNRTFSHDSEEITVRTKKLFVQKMKGTPYYPELINEVLAEEFSPDADSLKEKLLERLKIEEESKAQKKREVPLKNKLFEALHSLASAEKNLLSALNKLQFNSQLLDNRKLTLGEKFKRWLIRSVYGERDSKIYEIEYINSTTGISKTEKLDFNSFVKDINKMIVLFSKILSKNNVVYQKLNNASEDSLLDFLTKRIGEMEIMHRRMEALNTYFLSELKRNEREKAKGIKIELSGIKNSIVKANKKRYEYVSTREEREQLKRLGIKDVD